MDIPTSIAHAQHSTATSNTSRRLLSAEPLREAFVSTEPKSEKSRANLLKKCSIDLVAGEVYVRLVKRAFQVVREQFDEQWCLERKFVLGVRGRKRKVDEISKARTEFREDHGNQSTKLGSDLLTLSSSARQTIEGQNLPEVEKDTFKESTTIIQPSTPVNLLNQCKPNVAADSFRQGEEILSRLFELIEVDKGDQLLVTITTASETVNKRRPEVLELNFWNGTFHNEFEYPVQMTITETESSPTLSTMNLISSMGGTQTSCTFYIPPLSTFILSNCKNSSKFRNTIRTYNASRAFSLILLDPPWPNASVKRKAAYSTASALRELKNLILSMDLDQYIAPNAYVGIWITNNPTIRKLVLGDGGLFEHLNVGLVEEWIWVKTTITGEPVTALDGLWRRPYEVLLLGRAPGSRMEIAQGLGGDEVTRRVIFGVADLHSRKPCLKVLIEGLGMVPKGYQALEIFARYCVTGWWAWGNEALKFCWNRYWDDGLEQVVDFEQHV